LFGFLSDLSRLVSVSNLELTNITTAAYFFKTLAHIDMYNADIVNIPA
jgi:hypothetical protein